jgi:hypothetical protein
MPCLADDGLKNWELSRVCGIGLCETQYHGHQWEEMSKIRKKNYIWFFGCQEKVEEKVRGH